MNRGWQDTKKENRIALYGLGTETERYLQGLSAGTKVIGLLDSYRTEGELYGYSIISLQQAANAHIQRK